MEMAGECIAQQFGGEMSDLEVHRLCTQPVDKLCATTAHLWTTRPANSPFHSGNQSAWRNFVPPAGECAPYS